MIVLAEVWWYLIVILICISLAGTNIECFFFFIASHNFWVSFEKSLCKVFFFPFLKCLIEVLTQWIVSIIAHFGFQPCVRYIACRYFIPFYRLSPHSFTSCDILFLFNLIHFVIFSLLFSCKVMLWGIYSGFHELVL